MAFGRRVISGNGVISLDDPVDAVCVCGKAVTFGFVGGHPAAMHDLPHCSDFDRLDPMEFIIWLNDQKRFGKPGRHLH